MALCISSGWRSASAATRKGLIAAFVKQAGCRGMRMTSSRWGAQDGALFLVLTIFANALLAGAASRKEWTETFYLALYVHLGFSLYLGAFNRRRTATWLMLIGAWAAAEVVGFTAFLIPTGQIIFWLTTRPLAGPLLARLGAVPPAAWPAAALVLLGLDLCAMHAARWRGRSLRQRAVFLVVVLVAAFALGLLAAALAPPLPPSPQPFPVLPTWPTLPFYALLRAGPEKLIGLLLAFAALFAPALWPWAGVEKLRAGRVAWVWSSLSVMFAAAWVMLGYLGAQEPSESVIMATRGVAAFYFAYFVFPFVLRWSQSSTVVRDPQ
jgi:hypothetical protein